MPTWDLKKIHNVTTAMDIKQLRNFCKMAELGSLTAVAKGLSLTQAALSRQLTMLESELQVELFRRTGRGLVLTAAGSRLVEQAHLILQQVEQIPSIVRGAADGMRGTLALGLPPSLARTMVVPLIEAFQAHIPEVVMRSVDGLSADLMELVAEGKLDCAIVYNTAPIDKVQLVPLAQESLYLVSGPFHGPALGTSVPLAEIANLPLIIAGRNNAVHQILCQSLDKLGKVPLIAHEIANLNAILDLVHAGHGYSVIPASGIHSCIGDNRLSLHRIRRPALEITLFHALPSKPEDPLSLNELAVLREVVVDRLSQFEADIEAAVLA